MHLCQNNAAPLLRLMQCSMFSRAQCLLLRRRAKRPFTARQFLHPHVSHTCTIVAGS